MLGASIALLVAGNILFYRALDRDYLSEIEVFELLGAIPVIIFASFIFTDERNPIIILAALIASSSVIWSHWERHHFRVVKSTKFYVIWLLIEAPIVASLTKELLTVYNPIILELFRNGGLALILGPLFASKVKNISSKGWKLLLVTNFLSALAYVLLYFSYQVSGVVYSVLVFSLMPLLIYFASILFLKEPFHRKKGIAFIIVLISVAIAQILG